MAKVRDKLWLAGVMAGMENPRIMKHPDAYRKFGSFISPVEAANYLNIPNIIMVNRRGMPVPGSFHAAQCVFAVSSMQNVLWSIASKEFTGQEESYYLTQINSEHTNFCGAYIDDIIDRFRDSSKDQIKKQIWNLIEKEREVLAKCDNTLKLFTALDVQTLYEVEPEAFALSDGIVLKLKSREEMIQPEKHLEHLQRTFMDKNQMLCIPFFDFEHDEPVSEEILECLCEAGLNGMQDGWLNGMVFEGNGMMGVGFPADRRVRNWIAEAGDIEI